MRLVCPNCDAQYDVADDVIPAEGRDVQCSNCSHTWFQSGTPEPAKSDRITKQQTPFEEPPARQKLDSSIADILREEASVPPRERANTPPPAEEPVATIASTNRNENLQSDETRKRIAAMTESVPTPTIAAADNNSDENQNAIPTIEEVNAALIARAGIKKKNAKADARAKKRAGSEGSFFRGFLYAILLLAIPVVPYIFAPEITAQFPQLADDMTTYVDTVNQLRLTLNEQFLSIKAMVDDMIVSFATPDGFDGTVIEN